MRPSIVCLLALLLCFSVGDASSASGPAARRAAHHALVVRSDIPDGFERRPDPLSLPGRWLGCQGTSPRPGLFVIRARATGAAFVRRRGSKRAVISSRAAVFASAGQARGYVMFATGQRFERCLKQRIRLRRLGIRQLRTTASANRIGSFLIGDWNGIGSSRGMPFVREVLLVQRGAVVLELTITNQGRAMTVPEIQAIARNAARKLI